MGQRLQLSRGDLAEHLAEHGGEHLWPPLLDLDEVDGAEGDVVPEGRQPDRRVGEDVAHPQFDETAEGAQSFESGADRRSAQGVEDDIDTLALRGDARLLGEVQGPGAHDVLDSRPA